MTFFKTIESNSPILKIRNQVEKSWHIQTPESPISILFGPSYSTIQPTIREEPVVHRGLTFCPGDSCQCQLRCPVWKIKLALGQDRLRESTL